MRPDLALRPCGGRARASPEGTAGRPETAPPGHRPGRQSQTKAQPSLLRAPCSTFRCCGGAGKRERGASTQIELRERDERGVSSPAGDHGHRRGHEQTRHSHSSNKAKYSATWCMLTPETKRKAALMRRRRVDGWERRNWRERHVHASVRPDSSRRRPHLFQTRSRSSAQRGHVEEEECRLTLMVGVCESPACQPHIRG